MHAVLGDSNALVIESSQPVVNKRWLISHVLVLFESMRSEHDATTASHAMFNETMTHLRINVMSCRNDFGQENAYL